MSDINSEDEDNFYFVEYFEGNPITFIKSKKNGEITINADDVVRVLGIAGNFEEYLATDNGLDFLGEWKRKNPNKDFFKDAITVKKKD